MIAIEEYWVEANIALGDLVTVEKLLKKCYSRIAWHFFREGGAGWLGDANNKVPHIRFRVEFKNESDKQKNKKAIDSYLNALGFKHYFGRHGRQNEEYVGEFDRFGECWPMTKMLLESCSNISLELSEKHLEHGFRFCRSDLLHLVANMFDRRDYLMGQPVQMIMLHEDDLAKKTDWEA